MKWNSFATAALSACVAWGMGNIASAVNPSPGSGSTYPQPSTYSPDTSGLNLYGTFANPSDPFFTPELYNTTPTYPGLPNSTYPAATTTPDTFRAVPNPAPGTYDDGRTRYTPGVSPSYAPPTQNPNAPKKWRLGVYSKDLTTGVKIQEVVNGGAAQRAGLEVNDQIIAVNGFQVGYVNGQLYDCGTEFERLADKNGWVTLLVLNSRKAGELINVPVQLDSRLSTLRGTVALSSPRDLPPNAVVNVELKEIIGNNSSAVTFASTQVDKLNQYPIPFELDFDPAHISPNGRYVVYASVLVNGREVFASRQGQRVLDQGGVLRPVTLQLEQTTQTVSYPSLPTQDVQSRIVELYRQYLGRNPTQQELQNMIIRLNSGASMAQVQQELLAHNQFFMLCNEDKRQYIVRLHELLINRPPTSEELAYWMGRYDSNNGIRRELAREFQGAVGIH